MGILAWYGFRISTGKAGGINNRIKVMKRNVYGFRDESTLSYDYMRYMIAVSPKLSDGPYWVDALS